MISWNTNCVIVICLIMFAQVAQSQEADDERPAQAALLKALTVKPCVTRLRQVLAATGFEAVEPLQLASRQSRLSYGDNSPVVRILTDAGERVIALASVRPQAAAGVEQARRSSPAEAAFIFDVEGELVGVLGGGKSASGHHESVMLTNLGGTGDIFVRVSAFDSHPPYRYRSRWYRIGAESKPSLTIHHYANSTLWSGVNGTSEPIAEYGFIEHEFNGQEIDERLPGVTANGARVPRQILWDGLRNKFLAESTQQFEGKSLYQVIADESVDFVRVQANKQTLVVAGGRRNFKNWHKWMVTVQDDQHVVARLVIRDTAGKTTRRLQEAPLSPGQHKLQLHVGNQNGVPGTTIQVMLDAKDTNDKIHYAIPRMQVDARPSVAGQCVYIAAEPPVWLFDKRLKEQNQSLVWMIEEQVEPSETR